MEFRAKYAGQCQRTGRRFAVGTLIRKTSLGWEIADNVPDPMADVPDNERVAYSRGEGYGGEPFAVGEVVRVEIWSQEKQERVSVVMKVLKSSSAYIKEDGMSFGVGDDEGYLFTAEGRLATEEEAAPLLAQEESARIRREKSKQMRVGMGAHFDPRDANTPEGFVSPGGELVNIGQGADIYGGGQWFRVEEDYIWHIINNGADGDNWSYNNVGTGGAGAIGNRFPRTPEREAIVALAKEGITP